MRLYRVVSEAEYDDLRLVNHFRAGWNSLEGKWFADTYEGVLLRAAAHYPDGDGRIVEADVPDELWERSYRPENLDHFGPATYLERSNLGDIILVTN